MSLGVNQLKQKTFFIYEGQPYVVLETHHLKMQQRRPTVQVKMRNLINGKILERNFAQSDVFEEADVERQKVKYLYNHRDQYWFCQENHPSQRFEIKKEMLGDLTKFLKSNTILDAILFKGKIISVELPIKMDFKVIEAPPAVKGDTAQGGVKQVKIETGATINTPLFINQGDNIRINTETGEYVERADKG
ncbi:MAG: elongation factor P [Candidatus Yanofskybacteria bacterium RIFCSPHIGHO2_01_FULL_39_8b]|uniref:Elongation factor P n=1 Tax=Candidatus Yanofskybacteria bacterium RIFCSPHIGHO2_01_FULL_39_8b TaxID=1802659 RepID=A0A1F8EGY8_9BACT|nr:MAG: elongation factor P [Candidatus Yanofskybacteria bacterium RIFCSPHIGHO2_01_FULL_39_8b]